MFRPKPPEAPGASAQRSGRMAVVDDLAADLVVSVHGEPDGDRLAGAVLHGIRDELGDDETQVVEEVGVEALAESGEMSAGPLGRVGRERGRRSETGEHHCPGLYPPGALWDRRGFTARRAARATATGGGRRPGRGGRRARTGGTRDARLRRSPGRRGGGPRPAA